MGSKQSSSNNMRIRTKSRKLSHDFSTEALFTISGKIENSSVKGQLKRPHSHFELNSLVRNDTEEKQV